MMREYQQKRKLRVFQSYDININEMDDPLKPDRSKDTSDDEDKDKDEGQ